MDPHFESFELSEHYAKLSDTLHALARTGTEDERLKFPALLASALSIKAHLRRRMHKAYHDGDKQALRSIATKEIPELSNRVCAVWHAQRDLWMSCYKPFGSEPLDRRYGGLIGRLESVAWRLNQYLDGHVSSIPELDAKLLPVFDLKPGEFPVIHASRVATPSAIK